MENNPNKVLPDEENSCVYHLGTCGLIKYMIPTMEKSFDKQPWNSPIKELDDIALGDGRLYGVNHDDVMEISPKDGSIVWSADLDTFIRETPSITYVGGTLFVIDSEGNGGTYSAEDGSKIKTISDGMR
jgi:hypothetical protein